MAETTIAFQDVVTKQMVENWADDKGFIASEEICLHLEERFEVQRVVVHQAEDKGDFLSLMISTDQWSEPREFALTSAGSLAW